MKTSVGRVALLLPILELLEAEQSIYERAELNFRALPKEVRDSIASKFDEYFVFLLFMDAAQRKERLELLKSMAASVRQLIEMDRVDGELDDATPLFDQTDMEMVSEFLTLLTKMKGTKNRREFRRYFEAVRVEDLSYVVLKNEPSRGTKAAEVQVRFAHHLPVETLRALRLSTADIADEGAVAD